MSSTGGPAPASATCRARPPGSSTPTMVDAVEDRQLDRGGDGPAHGQATLTEPRSRVIDIRHGNRRGSWRREAVARRRRRPASSPIRRLGGPSDAAERNRPTKSDSERTNRCLRTMFEPQPPPDGRRCWRASASPPSTRAGAPHARPGTSPSTSSRPPSYTPSLPRMSRRPSRSPSSEACAWRRRGPGTTPRHSVTSPTRSCSRPSACAACRSILSPVARASKPAFSRSSSWRQPPSTASPRSRAHRRTSASSATRSAAA